ncbi:ABC transporter substrate-binding protein [Pontiellaceae bacterium B12227]|nr:ABC transporter substrate-binding protein [Pontiellaceae bacterium B12227]
MSEKGKWIALKSALVICTLLNFGCSPSKDETVVIGVHQYIQHPVADEVADGIMEEFAANDITEENGYKVLLKNANGDNVVATQINKMFVRDGVDIIIPIATPSAQSACRETQTIPVVFAAITDPVKAGIADSLERPGKNRTGTSNRWPFEKQIGLIKQLIPDAKTVGMIMNPSEANTEAALSYVRPALEEARLKAVEVPVASSSEVYNAAKSLAGRCDVVFVLPDNTLQSGFDALIKVAKASKIPVIGGTGDLVERGSLASYAPNHHRLGQVTARIAMDILQNGTDPGSMPVAMDSEAPLKVNRAAAELLGIEIPENLK